MDPSMSDRWTLLQNEGKLADLRFASGLLLLSFVGHELITPLLKNLGDGGVAPW